MKIFNKSIYSLLVVALTLLAGCRKEAAPDSDNNSLPPDKAGSAALLNSPKNNTMTIYNWRYQAGPGFTAGEEDDVQIAVNRADWPAFTALLQRLKNGEEHNVKLGLSPLPAGSPHHLDVITELFNFPNQQFVELEFVRFSKPADEIWLNIKNNNRLQIRATEAGYARLLTMQANAEKFASIYANTTGVFIQKNDASNPGNGSGPFITAKLVMWGVNDTGEIVYN
jgi:hypothetical protein